ncbi:peroxiredoxin [Cochleicola gelatinilyticus]|uniref:thioredoxin-dependent peroxiredoxin n=1 Tax=Cochleicola gelatinilyticus TaxID=1763537 RepID=A0A167KAH5_9FLAO|nr:peroxiredoxin [Cochleicola gelatinilyticus]OAB81564.1 alkyl hydroperoxide reductase [Cochleicola gelatinilyticus]
MSLKIGEPIPKFKLNDKNGEVFTSESISGSAVIYFYPKNFTPGCTKEACGFRDAFEEFTEKGAQVIGISSDSEASHQKFAARYKLPFILLADTNGVVRKKFGVKSTLLGLLPGRETFVFNKERELVYKFESMNAKNHIGKALKHL